MRKQIVIVVAALFSTVARADLIESLANMAARPRSAKSEYERLVQALPVSADTQVFRDSVNASVHTPEGRFAEPNAPRQSYWQIHENGIVIGGDPNDFGSTLIVADPTLDWGDGLIVYVIRGVDITNREQPVRDAELMSVAGELVRLISQAATNLNNNNLEEMPLGSTYNLDKKWMRDYDLDPKNKHGNMATFDTANRSNLVQGIRYRSYYVSQRMEFKTNTDVTPKQIEEFLRGLKKITAKKCGDLVGSSH